VRFLDDPLLGQPLTEHIMEAMMGDIVTTDEKEVTFRVSVVGSAPIQKIEIRNGIDILETFRPYSENDLGRRIRVIWSGAAVRGRERVVNWEGRAQVKRNEIISAKPINFLNPERKLKLKRPNSLSWQSVTTGGLAGFDCMLAHRYTGELIIETAPLKLAKSICDIGLEEAIYEAGGLNKCIRVCRLPDENPQTKVNISRRIRLKENQDNPLYVCVYQEDGHRAWSSPIYVLK
jgi:hypothetical protein